MFDVEETEIRNLLSGASNFCGESPELSVSCLSVVSSTSHILGVKKSTFFLLADGA